MCFNLTPTLASFQPASQQANKTTKKDEMKAERKRTLRQLFVSQTYSCPFFFSVASVVVYYAVVVMKLRKLEVARKQEEKSDVIGKFNFASLPHAAL